MVAAALEDGTVTPHAVRRRAPRDPELRALLAKIEVVTNDDFTTAYEKLPVEHHTRVNVAMRGGERFTGEAGGDKGDLSQPKSDGEIAEKFLGTDGSLPRRAAREDDARAAMDAGAHGRRVAEIPDGFVKN